MSCERGVHRLVRLSPFDSQNRRHTSFASVDVLPELDEIDIDVNWADDVREDTFCASGAGGQHVNKTSSAVRLTHLPTGIVVQCQNERSQHKNRAEARKMLGAKLFQFEQAKRDAELSKLYGNKGEIAFGYQIRSYVLYPYRLVRDERTELKSPHTDKILDGDLQEFIDAYLRKRINKPE
jgi:peptide chain release factor 2